MLPSSPGNRTNPAGSASSPGEDGHHLDRCPERRFVHGHRYRLETVSQGCGLVTAGRRLEIQQDVRRGREKAAYPDERAVVGFPPVAGVVREAGLAQPGTTRDFGFGQTECPNAVLQSLAKTVHPFLSPATGMAATHDVYGLTHTFCMVDEDCPMPPGIQNESSTRFSRTGLRLREKSDFRPVPRRSRENRHQEMRVASPTIRERVGSLEGLAVRSQAPVFPRSVVADVVQSVLHMRRTSVRQLIGGA